MEDKKHWYDGKFYELFIAPNQDKTFRKIKEYLSHDSSVLDAGCGTGRLADILSGKYKDYTGIDPSKTNIETASRLRKQNNIRFINADVESYLKESGKTFDYAVISYVLHEINPDQRKAVLSALADYTDEIIIAEYAVPEPGFVMKGLNTVVEFMAGAEHYRNYKHFMATGGTKKLAEAAGLEIIKELGDKSSSAQITVLHGKGRVK